MPSVFTEQSGCLGAGFSHRLSQEGAVGVGQLPETQARQEALALRRIMSGVGGKCLGQEPEEGS